MKSLNPTGASPETKTVTAGAYGAITTLVTWILSTYVFRGHIPADLTTLLPGLVGVTVGTAAGWLARHTPRAAEVVAEVERVLETQGVAPIPGNAGADTAVGAAAP